MGKGFDYKQRTLTERLDALEARLFRDFKKGDRVKTSFTALTQNIFKKHRRGVVLKDSEGSYCVLVRVFPNKKPSSYSNIFWDWK